MKATNSISRYIKTNKTNKISQSIIFIMGDFNFKVRSGEVERTVGTYGLGERTKEKTN